MNPGDYFGEVSLLFNCKRTAYVKTTNYCVLARIEKSVFLSCHKAFLDSLRQVTIKYQDTPKKFKIKLLKQIEYFEPSVTNYSMFYDELQYQFHEERIEAHTDVIKMNTKCKKLIFVIDGELQVEVQNSEGNMCIIDTLHKGDVVG